MIRLQMDKQVKIIYDTFNAIVKEHSIDDDILFLEYLETSVFSNLKEVYQPDQIIMTPEGQRTLSRNLSRLGNIAIKYNTRTRRESGKPQVVGGEQTRGDVAQRIVNLMTAAGIHSRVNYPSQTRGTKGTGQIQIRRGEEWIDADRVETMADFRKTLGDFTRRLGQASADVSRDDLLNTRRQQAEKEALSTGSGLPTIRSMPSSLIDRNAIGRANRLKGIATPKEVVTKHTLDPTTGKLRASHYYDINRTPPEGFMPGDK